MSSPFELQAFRRDGYAIARSVFSSGEVAVFREAIGEACTRVRDIGAYEEDPRFKSLTMFRGDIPCVNELSPYNWIVFDRRVLECVKTLLGPRIIYHGDSTIQVGGGPRGYHKDCADRGDPSGVDWRGEYGLLRLGVYLQDHAAHSGGLKVRLGSHRHVSHHLGESRNLDLVPGDVVFWYLTTSHSGNFVRPRGWRTLCLHPRLENLVPAFLRTPEDKTRMALFCTFARPGPHFDRYLQYQLGRQDVRKHWKYCSTSAEFQRVTQSGAVEVIRPVEDFGALAES